MIKLDVEKSIVHGSVACARCAPGAETPVTFVPDGTSAGTEPGDIGWTSTLVHTAKFATEYGEGESVTGGFVIPEVNSTLPELPPARVQPDGTVIVTDVPDTDVAVPVG